MTDREQFEAWAKQPPMEWDCDRYTENEAWPGDYRHYPTQCAWDGWQAARAQPAQAVPALSDEEMEAVIRPFYRDSYAASMAMLNDIGEYRAIEQAVRAKMGVAVPMTREDRFDAFTAAEQAAGAEISPWPFDEGIRAAEKFHGIVGKEGGDVES